MSHPSLITREALQEEGAPLGGMPVLIDFDRNRLMEELLSLGNPKITTTVAELIAKEVEEELQEKDPAPITPEFVSEIVRFKLEELGLIEIHSPRPRSKKNRTDKTMRRTHPYAPRNPSIRLEIKSPPRRPAKVPLAWSEEGLKALRELSSPSPDPETFLENLCRAVAAVNQSYEEELVDAESLAVQFYNRIAALEFLPGTPLLQTDPKTGRPHALSQGMALSLTRENLFGALQRAVEEKRSAAALSLGVSFSQGEDSAGTLGLFFQLLKTSLENQGPDQEGIKQDLFITLQKDSSLREVLQWLRRDEYRPYFSLSLGVSGSLLDGLQTLQGLETLQRPEIPQDLEAPQGLEALQGPESLPANGAGELIQIIREHLSAYPSLRLFFADRCLESEEGSALSSPFLPTPVSPCFFPTGLWVPSGFVNLAVMVEEEEISWDKLRRAVRQSVHFLDNFIDLWSYPNAEVEKTTKAHRMISLGVMGLADLLYILRIPYNSDEALELAQRLAQFIQEEAVKASSELAKTRGAYPNYIGSPWQKRGIPVRNAHLSSLGWDPLPSLMAQVSPGIEPHSVLVALAPESNGRPQFLVHPFLADIAGRRDFLNEQTLRKTVEAGSLHRVPEIPEDIRKVFVTAEDIDWEWHLRMAYAFEKYFDHGVAKICPVDPRLEDEPLRAILEQASNLGLKSLWMKRTGDLPLELSDKAPEEAAVSFADRKEGPPTVEPRKTLTPRERPERLKGTTHKFKTCCGNLYVTINEDERGPFELFAQLGKSTGCSPAQNEMISRLISLALRSGVAPLAVLDQLQGLGCAGNQSGRKEETPSCTEAIALALSFSQNDRKLAAAESPPHGLEKLVFQNKMPDAPPPALPESLEVAYFQEGFGGTKAMCTECGSPFEKLNGSSLCPDCKKK